jgi:integrase
MSIGADAIEVLKEQRKKVGREIEYVFPSPNGGPICPDSVLNLPHRVLERAGLPKIRFHDLHHPYVKHTTKNIS